MSERLRSRVATLVADHGVKALRYCGVSVVNVVTGMGTLALAHAVFGFPALAANLTAWAVSTVPAYLLSRHWVWEQSGDHRVGGEILPFWLLALFGLTVSTLAVGAVASRTDATVWLMAGSLAAYGFVWVVKYLVLDKLMWPEPTGDEAAPGLGAAPARR